MEKIFLTIFIWLTCFTTSCSQQQTVNYKEQKAIIADKQEYFSVQYNSLSPENRTTFIKEVHDYLFTIICDTLIPYWYGTPWNFNGTTQVPRQGTIACGYFVTTVLSDAGFRIPRVKWAQEASETVIKKIAVDIKRFHKRPVSDVISYLNQHGDGLYIIGLDYHVGFISKSGNNIRFIHSNYYQPKIGVMAEPLSGRNPLADSNYRVVGKLLGNEMIENWITKKIY